MNDPYAPLPPVRGQDAMPVREISTNRPAASLQLRNVVTGPRPPERIIPAVLQREATLVGLMSLVKAGRANPDIEIPEGDRVPADADARLRIATTSTNGRRLADGIAYVDVIEGLRITEATAMGMSLDDWRVAKRVDAHREVEKDKKSERGAMFQRAGQAGWELPISSRMSPLGFAMFPEVIDDVAAAGRDQAGVLQLWSQALANLLSGLDLLRLRIDAQTLERATAWEVLPGRDLTSYDPVSVLRVVGGGVELLKYILVAEAVHGESLGQMREHLLDG